MCVWIVGKPCAHPLGLLTLFALYFNISHWARFNYRRASVASEILTGVKMKKSGKFVYWRLSVASETLKGVTQSKIGDVCWRASEASETVLGVDNAKSGICYMYICMYGLYVCPLNARAGNFFLQNTRLFRLDPSLFWHYSIKQALLYT